MFNAFEMFMYAVRTAAIIHPRFKTSVFISYVFLSFLPSVFSILLRSDNFISQHHCTLLQCCNKDCTKALSRLLHNVHLRCNVYSDEALKIRAAQDFKQHPSFYTSHIIVLLQILRAFYYYHLVKMLDLMDTVRETSEIPEVTSGL